MDTRFNTSRYDDEYNNVDETRHERTYNLGLRAGFNWGLVTAVGLDLLLWTPVVHYGWPLIRSILG